MNTVVTDLISNAFKLALSNQKIAHKSWIGISHGIGSLLPDSLLAMSVQHVGSIDVLLRSMENESEPFVFEQEKMMSKFYWNLVFSAYYRNTGFAAPAKYSDY